MPRMPQPTRVNPSLQRKETSDIRSKDKDNKEQDPLLAITVEKVQLNTQELISYKTLSQQVKLVWHYQLSSRALEIWLHSGQYKSS